VKAQVVRERGLEGGVATAAVIAGLAISLGIIWATGSPVVATATSFWTGSFGGSTAIAETVARAGPLIMIALSWIVAIRAGLFNIGQSGQLLMGGTCATVVALHVHLPGGLGLILAVLAALAGGAAWAGIAALLLEYLDVNEIVSTLLLGLIATQIVGWLDRGPLKQPGQQLPQSAPIPTANQWPSLYKTTGLDYDIIVVLVIIVGLHLMLSRTTTGMRMRYTSSNSGAATVAGINVNRVRMNAFLLSGALAGFVGASLILGGDTHIFSDGFDSSLGTEGIVVALIALESPLACIPAALLISGLDQGGQYVEAVVGVSSDMVLLTEGIVVILVAGSAALVNRLRTSRPEPEGDPTLLPRPDIVPVSPMATPAAVDRLASLFTLRQAPGEST
jgi:general nucleoside transport system permease protein